MVDLAQTSIPAWAVAAAVEPADPTGRAHSLLVVGAGPRATAIGDAWVDQLADADVRRHECADATAAVAALEVDLATARTGHRVLVAGTAEACLRVRAAAVRAGLADDELRVGVVDTGTRTVWCVHCRACTSAPVELESTVDCHGCGRSLVVHPHVSRRSGEHLGYMVDAEDGPPTGAQGAA